MLDDSILDQILDVMEIVEEANKRLLESTTQMGDHANNERNIVMRRVTNRGVTLFQSCIAIALLASGAFFGRRIHIANKEAEQAFRHELIELKSDLFVVGTDSRSHSIALHQLEEKISVGKRTEETFMMEIKEYEGNLNVTVNDLSERLAETELSAREEQFKAEQEFRLRLETERSFRREMNELKATLAKVERDSQSNSAAFVKLEESSKMRKSAEEVLRSEARKSEKTLMFEVNSLKERLAAAESSARAERSKAEKESIMRFEADQKLRDELRAVRDNTKFMYFCFWAMLVMLVINNLKFWVTFWGGVGLVAILLAQAGNAK